MTVDEFVSKWLGQKADWDGAYAGQCVDLFRYYCHEVLKIIQPAGVYGAANFWMDFDSDPVLVQNFTRIPKNQALAPQKGDVMIWNWNAGGGFGHISIFLEGDNVSFTSFDQNWPTLSKCTKTVHNYNNVYGWLRPKAIQPTPQPPTGGTMNDTDRVNKLVEELKVRKDTLDLGEDKFKLDKLREDDGMLVRILNSMVAGKEKAAQEKADLQETYDLVKDNQSKIAMQLGLGHTANLNQIIAEIKKIQTEAPTPPSTPSEPPKEFTLHGQKHVLNGSTWKDGRIEGNYKIV